MIRSSLLAFAIIGAAVTVALVSRHGFLSADNALDGAAVAAFFAIIALGGLVGHSVAAHLWPVSRIAATVVFVLASAALLLNLSTSFEAIIGRAATGEAERTQRAKALTDAEQTLATVTAELSGLRDHVPVNAEAVTAARDRVRSAAEQRSAECAKRGPLCRDREADERTALAALGTAEQSHAITQRRAALEAQAATLRTDIANIGATAPTNTMATGLARLFRLPEADALSAATWHKLAIAALVELLIAAAFVAAEITRRAVPQVTSSPVAVPSAPEPQVEPVTAEIEPEIDPQPVIEFPRDSIAVKSGSRVSLPDVYLAYAASPYPALSGAEFGAVMRTICERAQWQVESDGRVTYLSNRRIKPQTTRKALGRMAQVAAE